MIILDQPTIFPKDILVRVSSVEDGTMLDRTKGFHSAEAVNNRKKFCDLIGIHYSDIIYQQIVYNDKQTYQSLKRVDSESLRGLIPQVTADGLVTAQSGVGVLLPVADCIATVIYDPGTRQLAVLHLGRHSTLTTLLKDTFNHLVEHGSNIEDIVVWMSPNAGQKSYKIDYFDHSNELAWKPFYVQKSDGIYLDLAGYNRQVCLDAGITLEHIEVSTIDTVTNKNYFSHSRGDTTKRFAVVAMMH